MFHNECPVFLGKSVFMNLRKYIIAVILILLHFFV